MLTYRNESATPKPCQIDLTYAVFLYSRCGTGPGCATMSPLDHHFDSTAETPLLNLLRATLSLLDYYDFTAPRVPGMFELKRCMLQCIEQLEASAATNAAARHGTSQNPPALAIDPQ